MNDRHDVFSLPNEARNAPARRLPSRSRVNQNPTRMSHRPTHRRPPAVAAAALLLLSAVAGCRSTQAPAPLDERDYPGTLQPPANLAVEAVWQQRVVAQWHPPGQEPQRRGFDAALQRRGDELTVLGLSPMGSIGFTITQSDDGIAVDNRMQDQLRIPPRFILLDVQRAFYPIAALDAEAAAAADTSAADGERSAVVDGERVTERREGGVLRERRFERVDGTPAGTITITYEWGQADWALPTRALLDNGWFGYQLTIDTHSETRLDTGGEPR